MNGYSTLALVVLLAVTAVAQVGRYDTGGPVQTQVSIFGQSLLKVEPGASVTVCSYPATGGVASGASGPCTNKATLCPDATGVGCTSVAPNNPVVGDSQGNFGLWAATAMYQYTVCPQSGVCRGPYTFTIGPSTSTANTWSGVQNFTGGGSVSGAFDASKAEIISVNAPRYLYANPSTYWRWNVARSSASQLGGLSTKPVHIALIGDSLAGFGSLGYMYAMSQYMQINALGYVNFYSEPGLYGSTVTYSMSGCTAVRNDNTSAQNWGPGGSRLDCSGTWALSYAPSAQFRFDKFSLVYAQAPGAGSFSYTIDGGAPVTVNASGTAQLVVLPVTWGSGPNSTHTVALANVSGAVTLYGISTEQRAQPGFVLDFLQSGGSQLSQWVTFPQYVQQYIAATNPGLILHRLGANDGGTSGIPAATFGANLSSFLTALSIPSTTATVVFTNTPRGAVSATPQTNNCTDDATTGALFEGYRAQIYSLSQSLGFSVYDERRYWPGSTSTYTSFTTGCNAGLFTDVIHPTLQGSVYGAYGLGAALFQGNEVTSKDLAAFRGTSILEPQNGNAGYSFGIFGSDGSISDNVTGTYSTTGGRLDFKTAGTSPCYMITARLDCTGSSILTTTATANTSFVSPLYKTDAGNLLVIQDNAGNGILRSVRAATFGDSVTAQWYQFGQTTDKVIFTALSGGIINRLGVASSITYFGATRAWTGAAAADRIAVTDDTGAIVAKIDNTGKGTFNGGVSTATLLNTGTLTLPTATGTLADVIASGTSAMGTGAITTGTCATVVTTAATNALSTDTISWSFNAAPGTGYTAGLHILPYVTAGNVNFLVCNPTAGSLTPAAATLNWRVVR